MSILEIEEERNRLNSELGFTSSPRKKVILIANFFEKLLAADTVQLPDSYILEYIETYIDNLKLFNPTGIIPTLTEKIIKHVGELSKLSCISNFSSQLNEATILIETKLKIIENTLEGKTEYSEKDSGLYFPVLEKEENENAEEFGLLESITIQIKDAKKKNSFHITPSGREIEKLLKGQIETSWKYAQMILKKYVRKVKPFHEVFIHFDKKLGYYTGNSLGAALTLTFLQELLKFYNSPTIIKYNGLVAVTGGLDKQGNILKVSKENLEKKVNTAFFSPIHTFVVAEEEKIIAAKKLNELNEKYPKRNLKIIGVEDFEDLLNRRNIVEIKKQKAVVRSAKYVVRHGVAFLLLTVVLILVYVGRFYDFDNNPAILINDGYRVSVQNKNGKELFSKFVGYNAQERPFESGYHLTAQKIIDIDGDGINEVILSKEHSNVKGVKIEQGQISCYDNSGNLKWKYVFQDSIESYERMHTKDFSAEFYDTTTMYGKMVLVCAARNTLYPSAVFFLELKTGERIGPTMWHAGHLQAGKVGDFNNDGFKEIVVTGINNSFERCVLFSVDLNNFGGQLSAEGQYIFVDIEKTKVNQYILLPKTDYCEYFGLRYNIIPPGYLVYLEKSDEFEFNLYESPLPTDLGLLCRMNTNFELTMIDPSDEFQVARDSLVAQGELNLPYTNTPEYRQILINQLRHWDGEKFVTREEYKKIEAAR